jgi:hypothetical protein
MALASGGLISGCDSDAKLAKSALGESCDRTSDCDDGLKCLQGACYQSSPSTGGSANEGGESTGGTTVVGPPAPVLGTEGESCTKRADCETGLGCYSGRCTTEATGEGGAATAPPGPRLGQPGETCVTSSDCEKALSCVPGGAGIGYPGGGFVGVCTPANMLKPSGKTCGGAECREAKDCCELPQALHVAYSALATYGTGASSCSELRSLLGKANCKTATGATAAQCFALDTYCDCADDTWSCDAGTCAYTAECTPATLANVPGGCPTYTRSGAAFTTTTCNTDGACAPEAGEPVEVCKKDADCEGMMVTNDPTAAVKECVEDECVCHVESGACYRRCDNNLDCDAGYDCDEATSLCTQAPACTTNEECFRITGHPNAACDAGECKIRCNAIADCYSESDIAAVAEDRLVCGQDHFCASLGCSSDAECAITGTGTSTLRMFCTEPATVEGTAIQSAITD